MVITVNFNGKTIRKPGSYSKTIIDLGGNFAISPVGVIGFIGEGDRGLPGSREQIENNAFSGEQLSVIREKYGPGSPLADAASLAFSPSNDGQVINGANAVFIYKTNESTQAELTLTSYGKVVAKEIGTGGNMISMEIESGSSEILPIVSSLHYLPSSAAAMADSIKLIANGLSVLSPASVPAFTGSVGDGTDLVAKIESLADIAASGAVGVALFTGLTDASVLTPSIQPTGSSLFTVTVAGSVSGTVNAGDIFILGGLTTTKLSLNGVYLATAASTSSTLEGIKLKDLASNSITKVDLTGPFLLDGDETDLLALGKAYTSMAISVDSTQAQGQGASLQFALDAVSIPRFFGGISKSLVLPSSANVAKMSLSVVNADKITVSLSTGGWALRPDVGDIIWILQDSQLAGTTCQNCGSFIVEASTSKAITMKRFGAQGTFAAVAAVTLDSNGVSRNIRCFTGIYQFADIIAPTVISSSEKSVIVVLENSRDEVQEITDSIGGDVIFAMGFKDASATAAVLTINKSTNILETVCTGAEVSNFTVDLTSYATLTALVGFINSKPGYKAWVNPAFSGKNPSILDGVANVGLLSHNVSGVCGLPARIKSDVVAMREALIDSAQVDLTVTAVRGLPSVMSATFLAGGSKGGTSAASIISALDEFQKVRINSVVPLYSRDSALDIEEGFTDGSSSYLIDSVHAAVKSHCMLMSDTLNRSERHCMLAYRGSYADCKTKASIASNSRVQLLIQDARALSSDGNVKWMQPHMLAAIHAGMRSGADLGVPLTFKYYNISGVRHTASPMNALPADVVIDFEPRTMYADAIDNGITFIESPPAGGFRLTLDNTTYRKDDNWLLNRGATQHLADIVIYSFRQRMEDKVVGQRNSDFTAISLRSFAESVLMGYASSGYLARTSDAPNGFKQLGIVISGNTVKVNGILVLAEGIDFVLNEFTLTRNVSQA